MPQTKQKKPLTKYEKELIELGRGLSSECDISGSKFVKEPQDGWRQVIKVNPAVRIFEDEEPDIEASSSLAGLSIYSGGFCEGARIYRSGRRLCLEFDYGSSSEFTDAVLKYLKRNGILLPKASPSDFRRGRLYEGIEAPIPDVARHLFDAVKARKKPTLFYLSVDSRMLT